MPVTDDFLRIDTPENVVFDYDVAGIGSRFLAALVDTILIGVLQIVINLTLLFLLSLLFGGLVEGDSVGDRAAIGWLLGLVVLVSFAFLWGYYIFFEMIWNGQSPGKRWVGLRVIRLDGTPITLTESIIRNLVRLVDFLPAYYGLGVIVMFINDRARRLGDLAAGTLVIRDQATITLESLDHRSSARDLGLSRIRRGAPSELPIERLTEADIRMAEDFLRRRHEFANREALARRIVHALLRRMALSPDQIRSGTPEALIREVVSASHRAAETEEG